MLYLITDPYLCTRFGVEQTVDAAVKGGATMVQLRDKHASTEERAALAARLKPICANNGVVLVINDDVKAAHISDVEACIWAGGYGCRRSTSGYRIGHVVGLSVETVEAAKQVSVGIVDYIGISPFMPHQPKRSQGAYWL